MFSTCLFCHGSIGANDAIEHFPVGKRLAFDGERGRLWAVCPHCARWNLAPIEERWEALEECEKAYRAATKRVSTDNIALARLKDGTDLVRIGQPMLPEFAAWRYGREFMRRSRRALWQTHAPTLGVHAGIVAGAAVAGVNFSALAGPWMFVGMLGPQVAATAAGLALFAARHRRWDAVVFRRDEGWHGLSPGDAARVRILHDDADGLRLRVTSRIVTQPRGVQRLRGHRAVPVRGAAPREAWITGTEAESLLSRLLPVVNWSGAERRLVAEAVERLERHDGRTRRGPRVLDLLAPRSAGDRQSLFGAGEPLSLLSPVNRLAAEMALHEDDERRALAGELGALYARWEEAERIARIVDGELTRLPSAE
jgi:hypothetical protein